MNSDLFICLSIHPSVCLRICTSVPVGIYMFKVNNKDTRVTPFASFWCLYC